MTVPFTPLWARRRPAGNAAADAWTRWPGSVVAACTVEHGGRTVYGTIGSATPHRLHLLDAATGRRLAPPVVCEATREAFALVETSQGLVAAAPNELVDPIEQGRFRYPGEADEPYDLVRLAVAAGSLTVSAHTFEGLKVWDLAAWQPAGRIPQPDGELGGLAAGTVDGRPHTVLGVDDELLTYDLDSGHLVSRWTAAPDSEFLVVGWAAGFLAGRDAVVTADGEQRLRAWDPITGAPLTPEWQLPGYPLWLSTAVLTTARGDLPVIACVYYDGVRLHRADTGATVLTLRPTARPRTVQLGPDGLLLLGTDDGPCALRLDPERLAAGDAGEEDLDLAAFPVAEEAAPTAAVDQVAKRAEEAPPAQPAADADSLPTHEDLVRLWGADQVLTLGPNAPDEGLTPEARSVLTGLGVPLAPLPELRLDPNLPDDGVVPLAEVGVGPQDPDDPDERRVPEGLGDRRWLGTWYDDDLLLAPDGTVEAVGPATDYERAVLLNSSLASFVACAYRVGLAVLRREPGHGVEEREEQAEQLERGLRAIDPAAFGPGSSTLWSDLLSDLAAGL